jgi:hypothetical protein
MKTLLLSFGLAFAGLFLSSCTKTLMFFVGVHQPRYETPESIYAFCKKKGIDTTDLLVVSDNWFVPTLMEQLNTAVLFDRNGYSINFNKGKVNEACSGNILGVLTGLDTVTYYPRDSLKTLESEKERWVYLPTREKYSKQVIGRSDYVLVYYWNMWSGNPNHRGMIRELNKSILSNPRVSIKLILVNQDLRTDLDYEKWYNEYQNQKTRNEEN